MRIMQKIGVDGRLLQGNLTGVGKYMLNLINFICHADSNICFSIYTNREITCKFDSHKVVVINDKKFMQSIKPMIWSKLFSYRLINRDAPDLFLAGDGFVPALLKTRNIFSVVHDLNAVIAPETMSRMRLITDKLFFKRDIIKARVIISNSAGTAAKLKHYYNKNTDLIIHPIIDKWYGLLSREAVKEKLSEMGIWFPYILTVATQEPRKNLDKTIKAFMSLKKRGLLNEHKLLLIGSKGWKSKEVDELITIHNEDVKQLGFIEDEIMPYLYNGADLFVFPSLYEGFGMPVREALLCGTPVVTSDIAELREATMNKAVYIDPARNEQFENAILQAIATKKELEIDMLKQIKFPADDRTKLLPLLTN